MSEWTRNQLAWGCGERECVWQSLMSDECRVLCGSQATRSSTMIMLRLRRDWIHRLFSSGHKSSSMKRHQVCLSPCFWHANRGGRCFWQTHGSGQRHCSQPAQAAPPGGPRSVPFSQEKTRQKASQAAQRLSSPLGPCRHPCPPMRPLPSMPPAYYTIVKVG
jgi:hypothetical protein